MRPRRGTYPIHDVTCLRIDEHLEEFLPRLRVVGECSVREAKTGIVVPAGHRLVFTSGQLGISPILMGAANSSGGVMGKMIDAQSIVVASTATNWFGHEGTILRFVFWHSIALACLVGILVMLQAYVAPFTRMVY